MVLYFQNLTSITLKDDEVLQYQYYYISVNPNNYFPNSDCRFNENSHRNNP